MDKEINHDYQRTEISLKRWRYFLKMLERDNWKDYFSMTGDGNEDFHWFPSICQKFYTGGMCVCPLAILNICKGAGIYENNGTLLGKFISFTTEGRKGGFPIGYMKYNTTFKFRVRAILEEIIEQLSFLFYSDGI